MIHYTLSNVSYISFFLPHCRGYYECIGLDIESTVVRIRLMGEGHVGVLTEEVFT